MSRGADHQINRLLGEIKRLVEESDPKPGQDRQLDALRWRLAAIVSRDSAHNVRAAA
jgi:hypothetical protein